VVQREHYPLFVFCGEVMNSVEVVDNEGKWRRMGQHVCYRCPTCTNKGKMQVGW
jgi:hypothetical protein